MPDTQGLRYGTTDSREQFFGQWKDEARSGGEPIAGELLDRPLAQLCNKARLLDLIRNFIIFDAGQKKAPRQHQFFGVKAAQDRITRRGGGVIWHTQGTGTLTVGRNAPGARERRASGETFVITSITSIQFQARSGRAASWRPPRGGRRGRSGRPVQENGSQSDRVP